MSKQTTEILLVLGVVMAVGALAFAIYEATKPKPVSNDLNLGQLAQLGLAIVAAT